MVQRKAGIILSGLAALGLLMLALSCSKTPSSSGDFVYEGKKLMEEKKYSEAKVQFQAAMDEDPNNADARYLHAKAVILESGLSILDCLSYVEKVQKIQDDPTAFMDLVTVANWDSVNNLYVINRILVEDLKPIYDSTATGFYDKYDIVLDYLIASTVTTILSLLDIFPPVGEIDKPGQGFLNVFIDSSGNYDFDQDALQALADAIQEKHAGL